MISLPPTSSLILCLWAGIVNLQGIFIIQTVDPRLSFDIRLNWQPYNIGIVLNDLAMAPLGRNIQLFAFLFIFVCIIQVPVKTPKSVVTQIAVV